MSAAIDHAGIPATDPEAAGIFLAWVLCEGNVVPDGPPGDDSDDMFSLVLDGWSLAFVRVPQPAPLHLAIRVAPGTFTAAVGRLSDAASPLLRAHGGVGARMTMTFAASGVSAGRASAAGSHSHLAAVHP
ncbi:MAG: hypothetical protein JO242_25760 [Streptosporangiaceae bacterium]|nr:hypothetical protein [Streptosporangiaceae bacterium]